MEQPNDNTPEPIKPDLKHDNMEYAASTDGDDILDSDKESVQEIEDEEITAEELELLQDDDIDNQAEALDTAETDSLADEDNFLTEEKSDEEFEDIPEEEEEQRRK
ncbi:MAG: hypothetical protein ABIQ31_09585 [Ferruginibacter sp.]